MLSIYSIRVRLGTIIIIDYCLKGLCAGPKNDLIVFQLVYIIYI